MNKNSKNRPLNYSNCLEKKILEKEKFNKIISSATLFI